MRQGNDVGTQYRSLVGTFGPAQAATVERSRAGYQQRLTAAGRGEISTEVVEAPSFYFAEPYHQQYLDANPRGYCGLQGTGVSCPIGTGVG
jgi:peptide-methionine (S)-S-oxide reductase